MKYLLEDKTCLNCECEDFKFVKGYCQRCYRLVLKIKKIQEDRDLPEVLVGIRDDFDFYEDAKKEYISQLEYRLKLIREAHIFTNISAHDLEYKINGVLRKLGSKSLGKMNDPIAFYLKDEKSRSFVYRMFAKIELSKPFRVNYYRLFNSGPK